MAITEQRSKKPAKGGKVCVEHRQSMERLRKNAERVAKEQESEAYGKTVVVEKSKVERRRTATMSISVPKNLKTRIRTHCKDLDIPVSQWVSRVLDAEIDEGDV